MEGMEAGGELDALDAFGPWSSCSSRSLLSPESLPWLMSSGQLQGTMNGNYRGK